MAGPDLNLLLALDVLLAEGSVVGAARRMNLSAPAMSRTLSRIRAMIGDPVLVRAGRRLVPTPRAVAMRADLRALIEEAQGLVAADGAIVPATLRRCFTLRISDGLIGTLGTPLAKSIIAIAPEVTLRFVREGEETVDALREGQIDLDIGVLDASGPEVKVQALYEEKFVGVVRVGHPLLAARITAKRFIQPRHISASRSGRQRGPIDSALEERGLRRDVAMVVPSFYAALFVAADSDLAAAVAHSVALGAQAAGLRIRPFDIPLDLPPVAITQAWHPRNDADFAHKWLREQVRKAALLLRPRGSRRSRPGAGLEQGP